MRVMPSGRLMDSSFLQFQKARVPIPASVSGSVILVISEHHSNAFSPIVLTVYSFPSHAIVSGMVTSPEGRVPSHVSNWTYLFSLSVTVYVYPSLLNAACSYLSSFSRIFLCPMPAIRAATTLLVHLTVTD